MGMVRDLELVLGPRPRDHWRVLPAGQSRRRELAERRRDPVALFPDPSGSSAPRESNRTQQTL